MITANNGILIVAMIFGWGIHSNDGRLMALALIAALASWVVNFVAEVSRGGDPLYEYRASFLKWTFAGIAMFSVVLALWTIAFNM